MEKPESWHEERRKGLGGSDMPAIMGVDKYRSPYDIYLDKIGMGPVIEVTNPMRRGTILEPIIIDIYQEKTNRAVLRKPDSKTHPKVPHLKVNADGIIMQGKSAFKGNGILEVKCPGLHVFGQCLREGMLKSYIIQLQHGINIWDMEWGSIAIFNAERWELFWIDMPRDDELIAEMEKRAGKFWERVEKREPPEDLVVEEEISMPEVTGDLIRLEDYPQVSGQDLNVWQQYTKDLILAKELKSEVEEIEKKAKKRIQKLMDGLELDVCEVSGARYYWREQEGRKSLDKKAMAADGIDIAKYEKQGKPFKVFRFYNIKPQLEYI